MGAVRRLREHLVLGPVRQGLWPGEEIMAWTHAAVPGVRAPGVLVVSDRRLVLHLASHKLRDLDTPLHRFSSFDVDPAGRDLVRIRLGGRRGDEVIAELSLRSRARSRAIGRVLAALSQQQITGPASLDLAATSPLPPVPRGLRGQARRVWVTVLGVAVLLLSAAFATPVVPGPGALTAVAGLAILASEYEWARDIHVWASRMVERFIAWMGRMWQRGRSVVERSRNPDTRVEADGER